ncbi:MAG: hypothetical protein ACYCX4_09115 [Bacillota bacterium]
MGKPGKIPEWLLAEQDISMPMFPHRQATQGRVPGKNAGRGVRLSQGKLLFGSAGIQEKLSAVGEPSLETDLHIFNDIPGRGVSPTFPRISLPSFPQPLVG